MTCTSAQQHLVALAVNLQLAHELRTPILRRRRRSSKRWGTTCSALDETARLAQRIFPPLLEAGGLAAALRSAAVSIGIPASVEVATGASDPPEVLRTVYFCCLEVLEHAGDGRGERHCAGGAGGVADVVEDGAGSAAVGASSMQN